MWQYRTSARPGHSCSTVDKLNMAMVTKSRRKMHAKMRLAFGMLVIT